MDKRVSCLSNNKLRVEPNGTDCKKRHDIACYQTLPQPDEGYLYMKVCKEEFFPEDNRFTQRTLCAYVLRANSYNLRPCYQTDRRGAPDAPPASTPEMSLEPGNVGNGYGVP